jgi:glycerol kinase
MFSALKIGWLLDTAAVRRPGLTAGTIDAWLVARLTGDRRIEVGNASRTQLLNVETASWDPELLQTFQVPAAVLPEVAPSDRPTGPIAGVTGLEGVRVQAVLADSHAALYAHGVRTPGEVKVTYGTGSSVLGLVGDHASQVAGLVRTIAWATPHPVAAREGNILSTGGTVTWLAELLGVTPGEVFTLARTAPSDHGVDIVPAFAGLAAPWWDEHAVAIISGFTRGSGRPELARAALESIALQVEDLATRFGARTLIADGGPASDDFLMQLQADLSRRTVYRSDVPELSALGAAHLAGIVAGVWTGAGVAGFPRPRTTFEPAGAPEVAHRRRQRWHEAIAQSRHTKENHD